MMNIEIENDCLLIEGQKLPDYKIIMEIGRGANGIVYLAENILLDRLEAIKVWVNMKDDDDRDKYKQGLLEAQKLARADEKYAIKVFGARNFYGHFVANMEYFKSDTIDKFVARSEASKTCFVLRLYLEAIEKTSKPDNFHGDPHIHNVLMQEKYIDYEHVISLKLCDFGTSIFSGREYSYDRHWRIVEETILRLTNKMKSYTYAKQLLKDLKRPLISTQNQMSYEGNLGKIDFYNPKIYTAPYKDYLEYLESEN